MYFWKSSIYSWYSCIICKMFSHLYKASHDFFPKRLLVLNQKNTIQNSKSLFHWSSPKKDNGTKFSVRENSFCYFHNVLTVFVIFTNFVTQMEEITGNISFYPICCKSLMSLSKMKLYMSKRNKEDFMLQNNFYLT